MRFELIKFDSYWATFRHFPGNPEPSLHDHHTYIMPRDEFNARGKPGYLDIDVKNAAGQ